ncbi:conserved hypothetical protein [Trichinella spiralis]|uniref:hypothetical protein n=1 Tax=Trichinella spiralis TaxID=6334 RepID=UPI0001EFF050|nr:conserved hypothetical protein [Trichinella spiralis]
MLEEAARYKFSIAEADSTTSPTRISGRFLYNVHPAAYQITAIAARTLETAHDRLAHRWHWDFGLPPIAHASHTSLSSERMILVHEHQRFKGDSSVMDTQPYRSAYFFPLTREQPLHQCECAVEFRYNITLGILHFYPSRSYGLYEFDIAEDDSSTSPTRISGRFPNNGHPAAYQFTAIAARTLATAHDRLAHRWHWDFGLPPIAHASHTSLSSERMILVHEHRRFKGDSSVMDTQPYV